MNDPFAVFQAMRGNPDFTASNTKGATGNMAVATFLGGAPVLRDVRMSLSEDMTVLTLQIEGLGTVNLPADGTPGETSGSWGEFFDGRYVTLFTFDDTGTIAYSDNRNIMSTVNGQGVFGLETPLDRLPTGSGPVSYSGDFETIGYVTSYTIPAGAATDGTMSMLVDFDSRTISGTTAGDIYYITSGKTLQVDGGATGTISGSVSGNGVAGSFTLNGAESSAFHSFEGNVFGWNADDIGGGVVASITGPGGTGYAYGTFETTRD
ncbi:hypothetical protein GQ651_12540 [Alphaproteobacteria bacterium GH1-50]|uniref:Transferrin-binding protein B C-lobe/N-lobe beta-barrel domain-containing protein n=1 Tax=Kangsaoukella pontilimi TaxID=2691042 RepID=A0A7C9MGZ8_9RHOB|nr:transferrin-binding protein-like solute binding protein [Kangsaoukella pontilimi]MXQ08676.1 hypothetical protein [Kangsaoukella pontilimi]